MNKMRFKRNGMIGTAAVGLVGLALAGCCSEKDKAFTDQARPEWSYDKPFYVRPVETDKSLTKFDQGIPEIYTQKRLLQIPRPTVGDPKKAPRVAVWMTKDHGLHWERIGYFGLEQSYFPYEVDGDGTYGIRFIGPGIPPAECKPPRPHLIYHVDSESPCVVTFIKPDQECYLPGQQVTVEWYAYDPNLEADSVDVGICIGGETEKPRWVKLGANYPAEGCLTFIVPDEAIDKVITLRVIAWDKAKNLGHGYTCPITVVYEPQETVPPTTEPCSQPAVEVIETEDGPQVLTTMPQTYPSLEE